MLFSSQSRLLLALLFCLVAAPSVTARFDAHDTGRRGLVQASAADEEARCDRPTTFLCDCEVVSRGVFFEIRKTFGDEELKCEAKCGSFTPPSCDPRCNTVICISGILGKNDEFCGTSLKRVDAEAIRSLDCEYDEDEMVYICLGKGHRLYVDEQTFETVNGGSCVPGCKVDVDNLQCSFTARYWGEEFAEPPVAPPSEAPPSEPPEEPPEAEPSEPPEAEPSEPPEAEPSEPPEIEPTEPPDIEPSEPPEEPVDDITYIELDLPPLPEIYSFDTDLFESIEQLPDPPSPSPVLVRIEIPVEEAGEAAIENTYYYGPWSDCTQYCSQNGPRIQRRSVICRNSFGIPLPLNQCDEFKQPDTVRECAFAKCVGDYYYILGDWSKCTQECAMYDPDTKRMSEGFREQQFTCHYLNGTQTNNKQCLERMEDAGIDRRSVCGSRPCRPVRYLLGTWGECDCETKIRTRTVTCTDFEGISVDDDFCTALGIPKPRTAEYCLPEKC